MGGEEGFSPLSTTMQILHNRPGNRHPVISARTASYLVEQHQRPLGKIVQNSGRFEHFHHKSGLSAGNIVRSPDSGKYFVHNAYFCAICGNERAYLSHQHYQGRLSQKRRFSGHIGSGKNNYLLRIIGEEKIVWHILLSGRHTGLDHGVTASLYIKFQRIIHLRTTVIIIQRQAGKTCQHVETGHHGGVALYNSYLVLNRSDQGTIYFRFESEDFFLRPEDLLFILLQFGSDISLRTDQRLLADPLRRHPIFVGRTSENIRIHCCNL